MQRQQSNPYLERSIQTATPAQLLIMLCDGAIRFCRTSIQAIENNDMETANEHLIRVQDIILEFVITLDKSSPVAEGLVKLYDYFVHLLIEANTNKIVEPVEEVLGYLIELRETWAEAAIAAKHESRPLVSTGNPS